MFCLLWHDLADAAATEVRADMPRVLRRPPAGATGLVRALPARRAEVGQESGSPGLSRRAAAGRAWTSDESAAGQTSLYR
jgi:hypothetical protein